MNILERISNPFKQREPLPAGSHHKQAALNENPYRLHLRLQKDGAGILIVNASTVLQLNPTAAEHAYHFIKGSSPNEAAKEISNRYNIGRKQAQTDYEDFCERINVLISTPDLDPASYLDFDRIPPHSLDTPLRLDCAITYRLPEQSQANYAPVKRVDRELSTEEWQTIIDKAWRMGIPHIIFTGGEATLRDDLPQLIAHAEKNGQVCGLLTDGIKLWDEKYLDTLLQTGLDHIMVILQPDTPASWKSIETILPKDLFLTVHLTLTRENQSQAKEALIKLSQLGVESLSLSAAENSLTDEILELQGFAQTLNLKLRWDMPVPYSSSNPVAFETADEEIPTGAGKTWLYLEPDGDILPAQGESDKIMGNFLKDDLSQIILKS